VVSYSKMSQHRPENDYSAISWRDANLLGHFTELKPESPQPEEIYSLVNFFIIIFHPRSEDCFFNDHKPHQGCFFKPHLPLSGQKIPEKLHRVCGVCHFFAPKVPGRVHNKCPNCNTVSCFNSHINPDHLRTTRSHFGHCTDVAAFQWFINTYLAKQCQMCLLMALIYPVVLVYSILLYGYSVTAYLYRLKYPTLVINYPQRFLMAVVSLLGFPIWFYVAFVGSYINLFQFLVGGISPRIKICSLICFPFLIFYGCWMVTKEAIQYRGSEILKVVVQIMLFIVFVIPLSLVVCPFIIVNYAFRYSIYTNWQSLHCYNNLFPNHIEGVL